MVITVLSENSSHPDQPGLAAGHGLSLHIDLGDYAILYDFGSGDTMVENSRLLGISLGRVKEACLSHGHYDHSGGLAAFLRLNSGAPVFHGPGAFVPRWSLSKGAPREVGVPDLAGADTGGRLIELANMDDRKEYVILPAAPGHLNRPAGNSLLLAGTEGERLQDDFTDELTLAVRGSTGLVVLTGCSHRGILNIAEQVKAYCPRCRVDALIGGFHLMDKQESADSVRDAARSLSALFPGARVFSGHCTEERAAGIFAEELGDRYRGLHVGMVMSF